MIGNWRKVSAIMAAYFYKDVLMLALCLVSLSSKGVVGSPISHPLAQRCNSAATFQMMAGSSRYVIVMLMRMEGEFTISIHAY